MRTTIRIDDALFAELKTYAARQGRTMGQVVEDAIRAALSRAEPPPRRDPVELTTFGGNGLRPGVDLDDSAGLLDLLEEQDAAP
ncbi:MAG: ribbon-helix-helix protein, CopG family [Planctomycetota bacterium]|jgi:plasmid stability protein